MDWGLSKKHWHSGRVKPIGLANWIRRGRLLVGYGEHGWFSATSPLATRLITAVLTARMEGTVDMKSLLQTLVRATVAAGLGLIAAVSVSAQDEAPGIVRITKPSNEAVAQQVTPAGFHRGADCNCQPSSGGCQTGSNCQNGTACPYGASGCPNGMCRFGSGCPHCHGLGGWGCQGGCCRGQCSQDMCNYFRCKFGYFIPTGAGGAGVPFHGKYARVYPQDPYYFDQRDGQAWGAQGYGMPMAVPLAPVVGHSYNYSWGTPSSRLTPISRPAY